MREQIFDQFGACKTCSAKPDSWWCCPECVGERPSKVDIQDYLQARTEETMKFGSIHPTNK